MCGLCEALSPPLHNEPQSCWKLTRQSENTQPRSPTFNKALTGLTQCVLAQQCSLTVAAAYALWWMGCLHLGQILQLIIGSHFMQSAWSSSRCEIDHARIIERLATNSASVAGAPRSDTSSRANMINRSLMKRQRLQTDESESLLSHSSAQHGQKW
ncbi:unnamed protein product [Leuciscus chuanchicus]